MKLFVIAILAAGALSAAQPSSTLSNKAAADLAAHAQSPSDHHRLAAHYRQLARQFEGQSKEHAAMAARYRKLPLYTAEKFNAATIGHCDYYASSLQAKAVKLTRLADEQDQAARQAAEN